MLSLLKEWLTKAKMALTGIPLTEEKIPSLTAVESQYEQQIKWQISLTGKSTNEKIVDFCLGKQPDLRHLMETKPLSEEQLKGLRANMFDVDGKPFIYRGQPTYRIKG